LVLSFDILHVQISVHILGAMHILWNGQKNSKDCVGVSWREEWHCLGVGLGTILLSASNQ